MQQDTAFLWSWLNILTKKRYDALLQMYGSLDAATAHLDEAVLRGLGCREDTIYKTLNRLEECDAASHGKELAKRGIALLTIEDDAYPAALRSTEDAPVFLFWKGSIEILQLPCVALVGTRDMNPYGQRATEHIVQPCVRAGLVTVSGLARGIDTAVAQETLRAGGKTVAVLGTSMLQISPRANQRLAEEIFDAGGVVLTEYPLDFQPDTYAFPARNRIIAGLSLATVVLEAGEGSGALITADLALGYGREVFAVPGQLFDPQYAGCNQAIARGRARLLHDPAFLLQELGVHVPQQQETAVHFAPSSPVEAALWKALTSMPQSMGDLVERVQMDPGAVASSLTMLELRGVAKHLGNGQWVRK